MKLVGLMACRNEAWVLGLSARVALMWCDELVIFYHACTDDSIDIARQISRENPERVHIIGTDRPMWDEMEYRQGMLLLARAFDATHIAIIDADEVLTGNLLKINMFGQGALMDKHCGVPAGSILQLPGYNLRGSLNRYHANGIWGKRWFSTAFYDEPTLSWSGDKFHSREPQGRHLMPYQAVSQGAGGVMHLWGVSERRLRAKHRFYRIQETLRWPNKPHSEIERMYSWATDGDPSNPAFGTPATWTYADVPESWWLPYKDLVAKYYHPEVEPWQNAWCDEMIERHGIQRFEGLSVRSTDCA